MNYFITLLNHTQICELLWKTQLLYTLNSNHLVWCTPEDDSRPDRI